MVNRNGSHMTRDSKYWETVESAYYKPPTTYEELIELDLKHATIGLGDLWVASERRQQILNDIREGLREKMATAEGFIPVELRLDSVGGRRVPVVAYFEDGAQGKIVGEAVLEDGQEGVIAKVEISGEYAENILKNGCKAFSLGYAPPHIDEANRRAVQRPSRWQRRGGK